MALNRKRALSLFLALILTLTMLPTAALASVAEDASPPQDNTQNAMDAIRETAETPDAQLPGDEPKNEVSEGDTAESLPSTNEEAETTEPEAPATDSNTDDSSSGSDDKDNSNTDSVPSDNPSGDTRPGEDDSNDLSDTTPMDVQELYDAEPLDEEGAAIYTDRLNLYRGTEMENDSFLAYVTDDADLLVIDSALADSEDSPDFTVTGQGTGSNRIELRTDCTVYLRDVTVQDVEDGQSAISIAPGVDAIIIVAGDCSLTGGDGGCGIAVPTGSSVTIQGESGGDRLSATGMGKWAAGIGYYVKDGIGSGDITIENLETVIATGGCYGEGVNDANGPEGGPAIGGGTSYREYNNTSSISTITLKNCDNVEAYGGSKAAGIGSGFWNAANVVIEGCTVEATGGATAPAIGTARNTYASQTADEPLTSAVISNIQITDSIITAEGGYYGAGIGSGYSDRSLGDYSRAAKKKLTFVSIELDGNASVTARGGKLAAGIGGGYKNYGDSVTIGDSCTVYAYAGENDGNGMKIPSGIGAGADGSGLFSDVGGDIAIADGAEVYAFSYGYEAIEPLASKWAVSRELDDTDTSASILQCRFLVTDTFRENAMDKYSEEIGVLSYEKAYEVSISNGAAPLTVYVPAGYTCVAATVEPGAYQVTVNGKTQSSLESIAYSAKTDGAVTQKESTAYEGGSHAEGGRYAEYDHSYQPYNSKSDTVTIQYTFGDPSANFVVSSGVNSFDAVAYRPSVLPTQYTVTYAWDGAVPETDVALPFPAVVTAGGIHTPDSHYGKDFTLSGAYNGVAGAFSFSGWDQSAAFTVTQDTLIHGTWTFTPSVVAPTTGSVTGLVFNDRNRNSIYHPDEDAVLSGVTVTLWKQSADGSQSGAWTDTGKAATTGADGNYLFSALEPGVYQVRLNSRPSGMNRDCSVVDADVQGNKFASSSQGYETGKLSVFAGEETLANAGFYYRSNSGGGSGGGNNSGGTPTTITDPNTPLSAELNTSDHYGYVIGYPEDYETGEPTADLSRRPVKPQGNITRAEAATIFFRMLTDESRASFWAQENRYSDVSSGQWFNAAISTLSNAGVIDGYPDGTFRPNNSITRGEFAALAVRFFEVSYTGEDLFTDLSGHWAQEYINKAGHAGLVSGYPDGTFLPQKDITRGEAVTLVNRTLGRTPNKDHFLDEMTKWPDNADTSAWYYADLQEATNSHDCDQVAATETAEAYESWTEMLETRDWAALEQAWADANASPSPGDVIS